MTWRNLLELGNTYGGYIVGFAGAVVQWECRDRYLWIHVASGQMPRFQAVGQFLMFLQSKTSTAGVLTVNLCDHPVPVLDRWWGRWERRPLHQRAARITLRLHHQHLQYGWLHHLQGFVLFLLHPQPGNTTSPLTTSLLSAFLIYDSVQ